MAGPYYSDEIANSSDNTVDESLPTNIKDLRTGISQSGNVLHRQASYTLLGTEADSEIIHVARFPAGVLIIPSMSSVVCEDPGTTLTVNLGSYTQDTTPAVDDLDKYSEDLALGAGGYFPFYNLVANLSAGQNEDNALEDAPFWFSATIVTALTVTADVVVYFNIAYKIEG